MAKSDVLVRMKADTQNYDANIAKARRQLDQFKKDNLSMGGVLKQLNGNLLATAARFASVTAAVGALGAAFRSNIETARGFEKSMSQLSSLTGMVGKDLNKLKEYAIELGSTTTLSASQVADAFKLIGSQQPQLLASGEALKAVTQNAITLAEAAGIELADAAKTLSVSINQMGGDSSNAERYINVLAAASQKGAGDIVWLGEAITKSGTTAKAVGTDYEELVANLEQLAKAGYDASTAGTALRSIIMNLEKQANNDFKPSVVGLTEAFENLGKANLDIVGYQQLTGKMFAAQAKALAEAAGEAKNMTVAITGTNTAEEQAKTNTDNLEGSLKSLASAWEGFNLHLNSSNGFLRTVVDGLKDIVTWADKAINGLDKVGNRQRLNNEGGNGNTKIDTQVTNLNGGSLNSKIIRYNKQVKAYEQYIQAREKEINDLKSQKPIFAWDVLARDKALQKAKDNKLGAESMLDEYKRRAQPLIQSPANKNNNGGVTIPVTVDTDDGTKSIKELQAEIKKLKQLRDEAADAGNDELRDDYNSQIKNLQAKIKSMRGGSTASTTHKVTKQEQAANKIEEAERTYAETLQKSAIRMEVGLDSTLEGKKKELAAQERLFDAYNDAYATYADPRYKKAAQDAADKIKTLAGEVKSMTDTQEATKKAARELEAAQKKLADAHDKLAEAQATGSATAIYQAQQAVNKQRGVVDRMQNGTPEPAKPTGFAAMKQTIEAEVKFERMQVDETTLHTILKDAVQKNINGMDLQLSGLSDQIAKGIDIPDTQWESILEQYNQLRAQIGEKPIEVNLKTGQLAKDGEAATESWKKASSAINSASGALSSIENPAAKIMGTIGQAIATIALAYAETLAQSKEKRNVWAFIATAAAAMISMATTISSIHSSTGYASGGIVDGRAGGFVGGTAYSGDNVGNVRLSSGELVLNRSQQNNLANALEGGMKQIHVVGQLKGEDIVLMADRYGRRSGLGELAFWK